MTGAQNAAFQAGSGVTPATLLTGIASVVLMLAFIWVIWVSLGTFRAWQSGVEGRRADLPPFHLQPHPSESEIVNEAIEQHTDRLRAELRRCRPATIATLGNAAARVMAHLLERKPTLVSLEGYGAPAGLRLNGRSVKWFALAHPAAPKQYQASHAQWMKERAR